MTARGRDWRVVAGALLAAAGAAVAVERLSRRARRRRRLAARCDARVQALHRFAVKGLGFDALRECRLERGACFPNDRSWALLRREELACFDPHRPQWVHNS
ncbi:unnamed protein product [Prorocentrum cordatum]|uniref:Uncharacterized protein n=1 Tax=Prorocentrum cordatum TaxID=2364126 RepID=A0ABN9V5Q2_9DINO|nr:unnamed protein product [Polarella glacialis]